MMSAFLLGHRQLRSLLPSQFSGPDTQPWAARRSRWNSITRWWFPSTGFGTTRRGFLLLSGLLVSGVGCSSRRTPVPEESTSLGGSSAGRSHGGVLNVVAHPDDDLLFLSPALLVSVMSGNPVHTVFLTAGDDGRAAWYWQQRELGIRSAYAHMAGVPDTWSPVRCVDPAVVTLGLVGAAEVRISFLRLPDGGRGNGFARYGHQSLARLWRGEQPTITAVDGSTGYSRSDLVDTVMAIMRADLPETVRTQDFAGSFGDGDHTDHHAAAFVTRAASDRFNGVHRLESYQDYPVARRPSNVVGALLRAKTAAFIAYAAHDGAVCLPGRRPCSSRAYLSWIRRQYRLSTR